VPAGSVLASSVLADGVLAGSIVSTSGVPAGSVPASCVSAGSVPARGVPVGSVPASSVPTGEVLAGNIVFAGFGDPAASASVLAVLTTAPAATSPLPHGHSLSSCKHTTRFPSPFDLGNHQPTAGIFSSSSFDDDFCADFTNLASTVVVDPVTTKRQVWKLVPLPDGKIAIGTKCILKNKRDARGILCKKQTVVATSSTEAEYVVAASCCDQMNAVSGGLLLYFVSNVHGYPKLLVVQVFLLVVLVHADDFVPTSGCTLSAGSYSVL
nr:hypothetical protein [Tanacetum cinerariifolium]